jgi:probable HAF family extracellular repeat protein
MKEKSMQKGFLPAAVVSLVVMAGCGGGGNSQLASGAVKLTRVVGSKYTLTAITPWPGDSEVYVTGLNNKGQVVGFSGAGTPPPGHGSGSAPGTGHAFVVSNGIQTLLKALPTDTSSRSLQPFAINDSGVIVGLDGSTPVLWRNSVPTPMSGISTVVSFFISINNNNVVLGLDSQGYFLWDNGKVTHIPQIFNLVNEVNNAGVAVGQTYDPVQRIAAAGQWQNGVTTLLPKLPGSDPTASSFARAVNNAGQVVGNATAGQGSTAQDNVVIWQNGQATDISAVLEANGFTGPGTSASDINDKGQVLGVRFSAAGSPSPFLYQNGAVTDVNPLIPQSAGYLIDTTLRLNNRGEILGVSPSRGANTPLLLSPNGL